MVYTLPMIRKNLVLVFVGILIGANAVLSFQEPTTKVPSVDQVGGVHAALPPAPQKGTSSPDTFQVIRVIDGDTVELLGGERVRLLGIDTPETVKPNTPIQCFGKEASAHTKALLEGKTVTLVRDIEDRDKYGRLLRYVYQDGLFVNEALIRDGYARVYTYPPNVAHAQEFVVAERVARSAKRGLWGNVCTNKTPQTPSPSSPTQTETAPTGCTIKGNINTSGEHIYHMSGCGSYTKTRIDTTKGERMFCTEEEAVGAGWRKAKNCP